MIVKMPGHEKNTHEKSNYKICRMMWMSKARSLKKQVQIKNKWKVIIIAEACEIEKQKNNRDYQHNELMEQLMLQTNL